VSTQSACSYIASIEILSVNKIACFIYDVSNCRDSIFQMRLKWIRLNILTSRDIERYPNIIQLIILFAFASSYIIY